MPFDRFIDKNERQLRLLEARLKQPSGARRAEEHHPEVVKLRQAIYTLRVRRAELADQLARRAILAGQPTTTSQHRTRFERESSGH